MGRGWWQRCFQLHLEKQVCGLSGLKMNLEALRLLRNCAFAPMLKRKRKRDTVARHFGATYWPYWARPQPRSLGGGDSGFPGMF